MVAAGESVLRVRLANATRAKLRQFADGEPEARAARRIIEEWLTPRSKGE
jgi:hypothetical protein